MLLKSTTYVHEQNRHGSGGRQAGRISSNGVAIKFPNAVRNDRVCLSGISQPASGDCEFRDGITRSMCDRSAANGANASENRPENIAASVPQTSGARPR